MSDDDDWMFDYIMSIFRTPTWEIPIASFVDENCVVFDQEEENKFAYTEIHKAFCTLVEELLQQHLSEIGATTGQFVEVCTKARNKRDINRLVFDHLLAVEDFMTFKRFMTKRNIELELEAVRELARTQTLEADALGRGDEKSSDGEDDEDQGHTGDDLDAMLQASLYELDMVRAEGRREMAELEAAIAASLALEEERLKRLREAAADANEANGKAGDEAADVGAAPETGAGDKEEEEPAYERRPSPYPVEEALRVHSSAPVPKARPGRPRPREPDVPPAYVPNAPHSASSVSDDDEVFGDTQDVVAAHAVPSPAHGDAERSDNEDASAARSPQPGEAAHDGAGGAAGGGAGAVRGLSPFPPLSPTRSSGFVSSLPTLVQETEANTRRARAILEENERLEAEARAREAATRTSQHMDEVELKRRAEHLRKQRDLLAARKKAEREAVLARYRVEHSTGGDDSARVLPSLGPSPAGGGGGGGGGGGRGGSGGEGDSKDEPLTDEESRMAMRLALTQRLREEMLTQEAAHAEAAREREYASLSEQLSEVEAVRKRNKDREEEAARRVREAAARRAQAMAASARGLGDE